MLLTEIQIANVIFNETRSLSGPKVERVRINIAHTMINANKDASRPRTAPLSAHVPSAEHAIYTRCFHAVKLAQQEQTHGIDPTNGARNFNFRANPSRAKFYNLTIQTQVGPLDNSYPTPDLPRSGIYGNTYAN